MIFVIIFSIIINTVLVTLIFILMRQLDTLNQMKKNYSTIIILQKIMETLGKKISGKEKMEEINEVFLKDYGIMFSTIVSYSAEENVVKASNVDSDYFPIFQTLAEEPVFKNNSIKNIPKYITTAESSTLKYNGAYERGIKSVMFLPLYLEEVYSGYWLLEDTRANAFDRLEKVQLSILKDNLVLILENSNYQATIEKMAVSDRLTGLYNRYYLYSKGRSIISNCPTSTIVMFDIDHFKRVNDNYGHDVGDKVLVSTVQTTETFISEQDIFVRFGGEEFVILFPDEDIDECKVKVDKIRQAVSNNKFPINDNEFINVTASYGMSTFRRGGNLDVALKNADIALYKAKQNGRNRIEVG